MKVQDSVNDLEKRPSFLSAKNSQELIADHKRKSFLGKVKSFLAEVVVGGNLHVRVALTLLVAAVLGGVCCTEKPPELQQEVADLCVYCVVYGAWFVFCLPQLLATIRLNLVIRVLRVLFKVFFAELAVMAYAYYRGHNNVLRRGFNLFPTLEANRPGRGLAWLGEAGYNLRLAALISCCLIAFVLKVLDTWAHVYV